MNHSEAVQQMAAERYLIGELTPEEREAFEAHYFDCQECALDVRAGAAFVDEARVQLPELAASSAGVRAAGVRPARNRPSWFVWWRPAFAAPAFALLLAVVGYQNLATIPHLRSAATEPRLLPWLTLHAGTRGAAHMPVQVAHGQGVVLLIDVPPEAAYTSLAFELDDPQGRPFWQQTLTPALASPADESGGQPPLSLLIPGAGLQQGAYTLTISGITAQGSRTQLDRRILDVRFN